MYLCPTIHGLRCCLWIFGSIMSYTYITLLPVGPAAFSWSLLAIYIAFLPYEKYRHLVAACYVLMPYCLAMGWCLNVICHDNALIPMELGHNIYIILICGCNLLCIDAFLPMGLDAIQAAGLNVKASAISQYLTTHGFSRIFFRKVRCTNVSLPLRSAVFHWCNLRCIYALFKICCWYVNITYHDNAFWYFATFGLWPQDLDCVYMW